MTNFLKHRLVKFINFFILIISTGFLVSMIDNYSKLLHEFSNEFDYEDLIPIGIIMAFILSFIIYIATLGRRANKLHHGKIVLNIYDKIYTEFQVLIFLGFAQFAIYLFRDINAYLFIQKVAETLHVYLNFGLYKFYDFNLVVAFSFCMMLILFPTGSMVKHIKNKSLFTNTLIYNMCLWIDLLVCKISKNKTNREQFRNRLITIFILALIPVIGWIMILVLGTKWNNELASDLNNIKNTTRRIFRDEYDVVPSETYLETSKEIIDDLSVIKNNINNMVEEKVKDEKEKIQMILDASFDLKNPLESILENVKILEKDPELSTKNKKCIEIIKSRSERLNQLSLEINCTKPKNKKEEITNVNLKEVDIFSFLAKGLSEIEQEMKKSNMNIKLNIKKAKIAVSADENLLWRAFENLIKDVFKHGQKGTNVFISIEEDKGFGIISIRNEIKDEDKARMQITDDEFKYMYLNDLDRRSSLSVTKSLMEKQNGMVDIKIKENNFIAYLILKAID